jgi:hypothetical protein
MSTTTTTKTEHCQGAELNGERCESEIGAPLNLCRVRGRDYWLCGTGCGTG